MKEGKRRVLSRRAVATRHPVQRLLEVVAGRGNVLILTHDNPDPDAIASAHALGYLLKERLSIHPLAAFGGIVGRAENSAMLRDLNIELRHVSQVDLEAYETIALVDTQPGAGNYSLAPDRRPNVVIDHHPPRPETRKAEFRDIRPGSGATSTMLAEYLWQAGVSIPSGVATALLFGIKTETQDLVRMAGRNDIDTYLRLYALADVPVLAEIQRPKLEPAYFDDLCAGLQTATTYGRVAICSLTSPSSPDMAAELADFLLRVQGVSWSICFAYYGGELFISLRTGEAGANAGEVVRRVIGTRGSAGGHDVMAGARVSALPAEAAERERLGRDLKMRFLKVLDAADAKGRLLLGKGAR